MTNRLHVMGALHIVFLVLGAIFVIISGIMQDWTSVLIFCFALLAGRASLHVEYRNHTGKILQVELDEKKEEQ